MPFFSDSSGGNCFNSSAKTVFLSGAAAGEQRNDGPGCVGVQVQAEFRASPQHILPGKRPFLFDEPAEFALAEAVSETATEILRVTRGTEDAPGIAAIAAG